jgi:hypothetical protein
LGPWPVASGWSVEGEPLMSVAFLLTSLVIVATPGTGRCRDRAPVRRGSPCRRPLGWTTTEHTSRALCRLDAAIQAVDRV